MLLKKGNSVVICIHIPELGQKMAFSVEVDKYSAVNVSGGNFLKYNQFGKYNNNKALSDLIFFVKIKK